MNKKCITIIILLLLVVAGGAYKFVLQGSVTPAADGRSSLQLNSAERDLVLAEMRAFLASVQQITAGVAADDMEQVARAARAVGKAAQGEVPGTLVAKLPLAFKRLGFNTHSRFDQLALDADDLGDANQTLTQLAELMQNCVDCHQAYRIDVSDEGKSGMSAAH